MPTTNQILGNTRYKLASAHDFLALFETRETEERKATANQHLHEFKYFSSYIDQYKGGVGLLVWERFLKLFHDFDPDRDWQSLATERIGRLRLHGSHGALHIFVVYLDPSDRKSQTEHIRTLAESLDPRVHSLIVGDFNFVQEQHDRYLKSSGVYSADNDEPVAKEWK